MLVVTDGAPGLIRAVETSFPRALRQRCLVHRLRNLQSKAPESRWPEIALRARGCYEAASPALATVLRDDFVQTYERELPAVVQCFRDDFDACIAHLRFPLRHRRVVRTTNLLERLFLEERRRTKIIPNAFGERPVLKLMYAANIRAAERWRGITVDEFEQRQLNAIHDELNRAHAVRTAPYDTLDRLTSQTTALGTVSYQYDVLGRRTQMTVSNQNPVTYAYDTASRLTSVTQGSSVVQFTYDTASRRTSLTLPNGVSTQYGYDAASQLTALTYKLGATTLGDLQYLYDAGGGRIQVDGTWACSGVPQTVSAAMYNANNQQLTFASQNLTYDLNGNLTSDGTNTYTWDTRNRLTAITGPVPASFVYDATGRRSRKTINGVTTDFVYDALNPVQEQSGSTTTNLLTGLAVDEYLGRADASGTAFFLAAALGSTIGLTDTSGNISTMYTYEPFGATSTTGMSTLNSYDFTGREQDGTVLKYYRARYYHPAMQRFVSEDPIGLPGGPNAYLYVDNDPLGLVDPTGLFPGSAALQCAQGAGRAPLEFYRSYSDMRRAGWRRADKYFHCLANCRAAQGGPCGRTAATWLSDAKEWWDQNVKGYPSADSEQDQAANRIGRCEGSRYPQTPCDQLCGPYRPPGLPPQYGGQMPPMGP